MASAIQVGTDDGLHVFGEDAGAGTGSAGAGSTSGSTSGSASGSTSSSASGSAGGSTSGSSESGRVELRGHKVGSLVADGDAVWALVGGYAIYRTGPSGFWRMTNRLAGRRSRLPRQASPPVGTCLYADKEGLLVGTTGAHLLRIVDDEAVKLETFDKVTGRDSWSTPWGDPPDVRSISGDGRGTTYVNVHVGGIPKSSDGGTTWVPTIDISADVHEVLSVPDSSRVLAATARGLGVSDDGGMTWSYVTEGLRGGSYCRAIAMCGEQVFVSASASPEGARAGVYVAPAAGEPFKACKRGLPKTFDGNIDTHCLATAGDTVAFGTQDGMLWVSDDRGYSWHEEARDLPPIRCILVS